MSLLTVQDKAYPPSGGRARFLWRLNLTWRPILGITLPFILLPIVFIEDDEMIGDRPSTKFKAAYGIIIVAIFWMFEVMPLAVTSLLPIVLFPFLGVMGTGLISPAYFKGTNVMFFGGLVLALAVEYCNLHTRIALKVMTLVGSAPIRLLFGVMATSMFLSMWMSNTACCSMMLPILIAVLDVLSGGQTEESNSDTSSAAEDHSLTMVTVNDSESHLVYGLEDKRLKEKKRWESIRKMFLFGVAHAANLGGVATITGTGPNLVFQSVYREFDNSLPGGVGQGGKYLEMTFANWMALNVPATILLTLMLFIYLIFMFHGFPNWRQWPLISLCVKQKELTKEEKEEEEKQRRKIEGADKMILNEYNKLGPMNSHEFGVLIIFILVVLGWIFREPKFMKGWADVLDDAYIDEGSAAVLGIVVMFLIPRDLTFFTGVPPKGQSYQALLDWKFVQSKLAWGVILLLGGGFALSDAAEYSGLSQWIGEQLVGLEHLPRPVFLLIVMVLVACVTEVCSNVATANIILPIIFRLSRTLKLHPLYVTVPAAISCSFSFMLPVATPPNALVFAIGNLTMWDMVKTGAFLNVACIIIYYFVHLSLGQALFNYSSFEYVDEDLTSEYIHASFVAGLD